MGLQVASVRKE